MSANFQLVDQEILNTAVDGIDYGRRCRVLVRRDDRLLLWVPGQSTWSGTGRPWRYSPAHLMVHGGRRGLYSRLGEGGKLRAALAANAARIDAAFGEGVSKLVVPDKTLVL